MLDRPKRLNIVVSKLLLLAILFFHLPFTLKQQERLGALRIHVKDRALAELFPGKESLKEAGTLRSDDRFRTLPRN